MFFFASEAYNLVPAQSFFPHLIDLAENSFRFIKHSLHISAYLFDLNIKYAFIILSSILLVLNILILK